MTDNDKELITNLALKKITLRDFFSRFKFENNIEVYIKNNLKKAYYTKSAEVVENTLLLYFSLNDLALDLFNTKIQYLRPKA